MTKINGTESGNFNETMKNAECAIPENEDNKEKILRVGQRVGLNVNLTERLTLEPESIYGVVKWTSCNGIIVGVEFDEMVMESFVGVKLYSPEFFDCTPDRTRIVLGSDLVLISTPTEQNGITSVSTHSFKAFECVENGTVSWGNGNLGNKKNSKSLLKSTRNDHIKSSQKMSTKIPDVIPSPNISQILLKNNRGMEWQANSCYLDATLFSMFYATDVFDDTLLSNKTQKDPKNQLSQQVMTILRNEIVYPLRTNLRCSGTNTAKLREALEHLSSRIKCSFMDAEDFLFLLLEKSLNIQEFLNYNTGVSDFIHQIIIDNFDARKIGFVQDLLETSMVLNENLKLDGIPHPALLVEMPRSDGSLVKFNAVVPNLTINLTKYLSEASCICGKNGIWFCRQCTEIYKARGQTRCRWVSFCDTARDEHQISHKNHLVLSAEMLNKEISVEMDLLAVICVRNQHYTTFVKCDKERLGPWLYFNSSDKANPIKGMGEWLDKMERTPNNAENILRGCPEELRRIALDCHICIYQPA